MATYLDASALVKLLVVEPETPALEELVDARVGHTTSVVARVELPLAVGRRGRDDAIGAAARLLSVLTVLDLSTEVIGRAARLAPLRALDAIHLASALELGGELEAFVAYDHRLLDAGRAAGLPVLAPA